MARIANETVATGFYHEFGDRDQYNTFGNVTEQGQWAWNDVGMNTTIYKLMQTAKQSRVPSQTAPELEYFSIAHFSPGNPAATLGKSGDQTVYLYALVALYEVDYEQYEIDHPTG
jgi:hypothetical protein